MKFRYLVLFIFVALSLLCFSCKDDPEPDTPHPPQWITVPEYDFPIFVARRGGVVTTSLETFEVTGFLDVGDSTAFADTLEWKVMPYNRLKTANNESKIVLHLPSEKTTGGQP